jgi:thioester reductase-like protein
MSRSVTHIVHNGETLHPYFDDATLTRLLAYPMNYNMDLAAFESTCAGVENLAMLAIESELSRPARFVFASSVSAVHSMCHLTQVAQSPLLTPIIDHSSSVPVLERPSEDPAIAISMGYGESKWVNETILLRAAQAVPELDISIVRIGQISGSRNGAWEVAQWAPSLMVSGPVLGCLPTMNGVRDLLCISLQKLTYRRLSRGFPCRTSHA